MAHDSDAPLTDVSVCHECHAKSSAISGVSYQGSNQMTLCHGGLAVCSTHGSPIRYFKLCICIWNTSVHCGNELEAGSFWHGSSAAVGFLHKSSVLDDETNFERVSCAQLACPHICDLGAPVDVALDEALFDVGVHGESHVVDLFASIVSENTQEFVVATFEQVFRLGQQVVHGGEVCARDQWGASGLVLFAENKTPGGVVLFVEL